MDVLNSKEELKAFLDKLVALGTKTQDPYSNAREILHELQQLSKNDLIALQIVATSHLMVCKHTHPSMEHIFEV